MVILKPHSALFIVLDVNYCSTALLPHTPSHEPLCELFKYVFFTSVDLPSGFISITG